jgi:hypothetical protein
MRRLALLLALTAAVTVTPVPATNAALATDDLYWSSFVARDRNRRVYVVEARVEDTTGGAQLVVDIRRRCGSCGRQVYAKTLKPREWTVRTIESFGPECQCFSATVETKFAGVPLKIDWIWDPEGGGGPAGSTFVWNAVTANNLLNVSCFGSGYHSSTPNPLGGGAPAPPPDAKEFPDKLPAGFEIDAYGGPGCHTRAP